MNRPTLPDLNTPVSPDSKSPFSKVWALFFNNLVAKPAAVAPVVVGVSPLAFGAQTDGVLYVSGGTVSSITLSRGATTIPTGIVAGGITVSIGDVVTIAFTVAPTVNFVPN